MNTKSMVWIALICLIIQTYAAWKQIEDYNKNKN